RRGEQDHAVIRLESVHLDEELVQGLLALVVSAAQAGATVAADRVDLIDEDDARRMGLALLEQVAHARGADADEHLDKVGARHGEKRPARFTRDRLGQQRLAGSGRSDEQRALGQPAAEPLEFLRVLKEVYDLLELLHGLIAAGDVGEVHTVPVTRESLL